MPSISVRVLWGCASGAIGGFPAERVTRICGASGETASAESFEQDTKAAAAAARSTPGKNRDFIGRRRLEFVIVSGSEFVAGAAFLSVICGVAPGESFFNAHIGDADGRRGINNSPALW